MIGDFQAPNIRNALWGTALAMADLVHLRMRVSALDDTPISLLAQSIVRQLDRVLDVAAWMPSRHRTRHRPAFTRRWEAGAPVWPPWSPRCQNRSRAG